MKSNRIGTFTTRESATEFLSTHSLSKIELEELEFGAIDNFKYLGSIVQQMDPQIENLTKELSREKRF